MATAAVETRETASLIGSDKVEGTNVYRSNGDKIGAIERIMIDYDGKVHLGVTIDGDPGQELLRDSGRLLFFFAPEVEALQ